MTSHRCGPLTDLNHNLMLGGKVQLYHIPPECGKVAVIDIGMQKPKAKSDTLYFSYESGQGEDFTKINPCLQLPLPFLHSLSLSRPHTPTFLSQILLLENLT